MRGLVDLATLRLASLAQLSPPYDAVRPCVSVQGGAAPFGTIVHVSGSSALAVIGGATLAVRSCPWVVPVLTLPRPEEALEPYVSFVPELRDRMGMAISSDVARCGSAAVVKSARQRPRPGATALVGYVTQRTQASGLSELLLEQFGIALKESPGHTRSLATYSRTFARFGAFTAHHWRNLAALVVEHCAAQAACAGCGGPAVEQRERFGGSLAFRVADRYARAYLGLSFIDSLARVGWEWIVETALRRAGYLRVVATNRRRPGSRKSLTLH